MATLKKKKNVDDIWPVIGKRILIRVDFNVPIKKGVIQSDLRIRAAIPTIKRLHDQGGKLILMSHLGRPKGITMAEAAALPKDQIPGYEADFSLAPIATRLGELLGQPVAFAPDFLNAHKVVADMKAGDIVLLENCRFYNEESAKKPKDRLPVAEKMAEYADIFVSDAFGTAHRDSATMTDVCKVMGHGAAGYLMDKEINAFSQVMVNPPHPYVAIVGGAKVSDKIKLLENMLARIDILVIGGAMAFTFLKAQGKEVGKSYCQQGEFPDATGKARDILQYARDLLAKAQEKKVQVYLPIDFLCNTDLKVTENPVITENDAVPADLMGLDIGPKTIAKFVEVIKGCKAAIWNGPMGVFETPAYAKGTFAVFHALADATQSHGMLSIVGGGDSASAAEQSGFADKVTHVSTGGGASLELMEGKDLPGISVLTDKE